MSQSHRAPKAKIVVVDDETVTLKMTQMGLEKLGFDVEIFSNAQNAFDYISENKENINLILTDKSMPVLSGIELTKKVRDIDKDIPIIILTGFASNEEDRIFEEIGVTKALFKPLSMRQLSDEIEELLN